MKSLVSAISGVVMGLVLGGPAVVAQPMPDTFAPVVKKSMPAVVNISSTHIERPARRGRTMPFPFPFDFGNPEGPGGGRARRAESLGSGVIISPDGSILTNNHVVEGATEVTVTLGDRREFRAKVVGADPPSDIAVLKIDATNLPTLPLGDSGKVQVGDVVLAIGNPFGIGQTVTMGIVSATGRGGLGIEAYEDFIQTDASINPGNSGGALINAKGELIGINTAILSGEGGGNQGIGFAIPIYMAREVRDQIVKYGKVTRGYMGIIPQDVTPSLARAFGLKEARGVAVAEVVPDAPASKAGLQTGDVITAVNNQPVEDANTFRLRVSRAAPGTKLDLTVNRQGKTETVPVTLAELPRQKQETQGEEERSSQRRGAVLGIAIEDVTPDIARELGLQKAAGAVVTDVDPASAAADAGLRTGDVILSVNRTPVANASEFEREIRRLGSREILLLVNQGGVNKFVAIEPRGNR